MFTLKYNYLRKIINLKIQMKFKLLGQKNKKRKEKKVSIKKKQTKAETKYQQSYGLCTINSKVFNP